MTDDQSKTARDLGRAPDGGDDVCMGDNVARKLPRPAKCFPVAVSSMAGHGHFWWYRVPGRAPEHWDKLIETSIVMPSYRQNERHVRQLLRLILNVNKLPDGTEVWAALDADVEKHLVAN